MSVTLRNGDSINLTTGVVTRSYQKAETITYPTGVADALRRNNLRALHLLIIDSVCAWTPEACHRSQRVHGRGDDCGYHPWWGGLCGICLTEVAHLPAHWSQGCTPAEGPHPCKLTGQPHTDRMCN